jgi:hypothetical protein
MRSLVSENNLGATTCAAVPTLLRAAGVVRVKIQAPS